MAAVEDNQKSVIKTPLEAGADPNSTGQEGFSVLHKAITSGQDDVAILLVTNGANVNYDFHGSSPLSLLRLSRSGNDDPSYIKMKKILEGHGACLSDFDMAEKELVAHYGGKGRTPAGEYQLALKSGNMQALPLFLRYFFNVNDKIAQGMNPIQYAACNGTIESVRFLLAHGADVNSRDDHGLTPLHYAAAGGTPEIIQILVEHGANVNASASNGMPVIFCAKDSPRNKAKLIELGATN